MPNNYDCTLAERRQRLAKTNRCCELDETCDRPANYLVLAAELDATGTPTTEERRFRSCSFHRRGMVFDVQRFHVSGCVNTTGPWSMADMRDPNRWECNVCDLDFATRTERDQHRAEHQRGLSFSAKSA